MSRNKKGKKVYTVKDVFDHYEKHRIPGGQGEAWEEYERLNEGCNDFREQSKENEQKLQRILKDARKKIPKYPGILSEEVKQRWKYLYEFLLGASQSLDLSDVWPKFDLITSIACMTDNEEDTMERNIDERKESEQSQYRIPAEPRSRNDFYSLPDGDDVEDGPANRQSESYHVTESQPISGSYRNGSDNSQRQMLQSDLKYSDRQGGSQPRPMGGAYTSEEERIKRSSASILEESMGNNEGEGFDFEEPNYTSSASNSRLSQLYNKEWNEAYKLLKESGMEESAIQQLLCDLLHKSYVQCKEVAGRKNKIYSEIKKLMALGKRYPFVEMNDDKEDIPDNSDHVDFINRLHSEVCQKMSNESDPNTIRSMCKVLKDESAFLRRNKLKFYSEVLRQYVDKCVETTWLLCTDSSARVLVFCEQGTAVDKELFSFYGSTGDTTKTCIWPALTTPEGGTVVEKGIVSPFSNKDDKLSPATN